ETGLNCSVWEYFRTYSCLRTWQVGREGAAVSCFSHLQPPDVNSCDAVLCESWTDAGFYLRAHVS
ncbi:hypothetical protein XENOCAPTIV_028359, partial [Xenoophorus captivus]